ncbi:hypothetical protein [Flexivirga sp.]|uniref:hypothetical protein n=1 Tax=Flexivirga sp. TaxID=1962927 RepID=UPI003F7FC730
MTKHRAESDADAYGRRLAALAGTAPKRDLQTGEGLDGNQSANAVRLLVERKLATVSGRGGSVLTLTDAGWARFRPLPAACAGDVLDEILTGWPARLAAMVQLIVFAVIARPVTGDAPRLGFALVGDTATGKSSTVRLLAALFGLDPDVILIDTPKLTDRPTGRLNQQRSDDGRPEWTFTPAAWTTYPVACFDEFAEISAEARKDLRGSALSTSGATTYEGLRVEISPVPVLAGNPDISLAGIERTRAVLGLKDTIRRRCLVLDTGATSDLDAETLDRIATAPGRLDPRHRLPLTGLPVADEPDPETVATLRNYLEAALTAQARPFIPGPRVLEPLVRACHALQPEGTPAVAAIATVLTAVLTVCDSIPGQTHPSWRDRLTRWVTAAQAAGFAHGDHVSRAVQAADEAAAAQARTLATARAARARATDEIEHQGAELVARCQHAAAEIDGRRLTAHGATTEQKIQATALRKDLRKLAKSAGQVTTRAGLDEQTERARPWLTRAGILAAAVADAHRARQAHAAAVKAEQVAARKQAAAEQRQRQAYAVAAGKARRAQLGYELDRLRESVRRLEQLWRLRDGTTTPRPLDELTAGLPAPLVAYTPLPIEPSEGFLGRVLDRMAPAGVWMTTYPGGTLQASGWPDRCRELDAWGPAARDVLRPVIQQLHAREDQLTAELGRRPRSSRPTIPRGVALSRQDSRALLAAQRRGAL